MILAVDDDKLNLLLLGEVLTEAGFQLLEADSIDAALQLENDPRIRLLLFDNNLNPGTGSELLATIRAREIARGSARRPAIVVTGDAEVSQQQNLLTGGFDQFVGKPYSPSHLISTIRLLIGSEPAA